jgi:glucose-1-phosphate adenylyltransferase
MGGSRFVDETLAVILAGGSGQRLAPLTLRRPKPLVSFGGMFRVIDFTLANCVASGLTQAFILTQYQHEQLQAYIREEWQPFWNNSSAERSHLTCLPPSDGGLYTGTADAVFQNLNAMRAAHFKNILVLAGDHVYHMDYRKLLEFHANSGAGLTIAAADRTLEAARNFGVIDADASHRVNGFVEKPMTPQPMLTRPDRARISMGIYVFTTEALFPALREVCKFAGNHDFGHHVLPLLVRYGRVSAYDFPDYWRDIGSIDSYYRASMELIPPAALFNPYTDSFWLSPQSERYRPFGDKKELERQLTAHAFLNPAGARSLTSSGVRIEENAVVDSSVLLPNVRVGQRARLRRVIVDEGVEIPAGCEIGWDAERDRESWVVTPAGVTVVAENPKGGKDSVVVAATRAQDRRRNKETNDSRELSQSSPPPRR